MIHFLIQFSAFVVQLDILKIYFCSKIDIIDEEVGMNRSSHTKVRSILLVTVVYKHYILLRMIKGEKQTKRSGESVINYH